MIFKVDDRVKTTDGKPGTVIAVCDAAKLYPGKPLYTKRRKVCPDTHYPPGTVIYQVRLDEDKPRKGEYGGHNFLAENLVNV